MALAAGTRLGQYEILSSLGAGGMGEVYRARDTILKRDVAMKVLPEAFAREPERLARFTREAEVLAALNHPNIAAIYGLEKGALVMELVEGDTLAQIVQRGAVPLETALGYAGQIADALEAAHEKGIVHRDLKPANVKVTPEGRVKVLDFGLAAVLQGSASSASAGDPTNSPTLTMSPTRAGMILGTAAYMSPEQARGTAVDQRADIWAFGLVLYEMLTGRAAFAGETVTDLLASVMKEHPDLETVPAQVRPALARCLSKDRRARWGSIGDVRWALDALPPDRSPSVAKGTRRLPWMVAAAFAAPAVAAIWGWLHTPPAPPRNVTRVAMTMAGRFNAPALSRDGTRLAYSEASSPPRLWLRIMDQLEGHRIPNSEGIDPAFSPDGEWIAYIDGPPPLQLKKVPVTGGTSITLCDLPVPPPNLYWGEDDSILFGSSKGLMRVPATGGRPENLTIPDAKNGESDHNFAELLPGGRAILFTIAMGHLPDASRIAVLDLKTHASRVVVNSGFAARYVPTGHLVYRRGAALFAVPFDLKRLAVTGSETPVVEGLGNGLPGATQYALSSSGILVYQARSGSEVMGKITWMDRKGTPQPLPEPPHDWGAVRLSPDGKTVAGDIATNAGAANRRIWLYHTDRAILTPLTSGGDDWAPVWTPVGRLWLQPRRKVRDLPGPRGLQGSTGVAAGHRVSGIVSGITLFLDPRWQDAAV